MSLSTFVKTGAPLLVALLLSVGAAAQAPGLFKFQAVARNPAGQPYSSENIAVRVSLVRGGISGQVDYAERHLVTTTDLGVFDLAIGGGTVLSGDFNAADWAANTYFLKIDIDPDNGTNYLSLGASQLMSVPYALYARESGSGGGGDPTDELQNLLYDPATNTLTITSGNSVTLTGGGGGGSDDQTLTLTGTTLSIEGGNTVDLAPIVSSINVDDADADPANEIQTLTISSNVLSLSNGGGSVTLPSGGGGSDNQMVSLNGTIITLERGGSIDLAGILPPGGTDDQQLSLNGNVLTLEDGGTVDLTPILGGGGGGGGTDDQTLTLTGTNLAIEDGNTIDLSPLIAGINVDDADADPSNELQDITLAGTVITLTNGGSVDLAGLIPPGGSDDQQLSLNGTVLTLEDGGTVDLAGLIPPGGSDDQTLTLNGTSLAIEDGNTIDLTPLLAGLNVDDADADPANELQTLSLNGTTVALSDGGAIDLAPIIPAGGSDDQQLALAGTTLTLEDGGAVDLSVVQDGVDDADADPANELQTLTLNGTSLELSDNGGTVDLSGLGGGGGNTSLWTAGNNGAIGYNSGNVGVGTTSPNTDLTVVNTGATATTIAVRNPDDASIRQLNFESQISQQRAGLWSYGPSTATNAGELILFNSSGDVTAAGDNIVLRTKPAAGGNQDRLSIDDEGRFYFNEARTSAATNYNFGPRQGDDENDFFLTSAPGASSRSYMMLQNGGGNLLSMEAARQTGAFTAAGVTLNNFGYIHSTQQASGLMIQSRTAGSPLHLASESQVGLTVLDGDVGIGTQTPTERLEVVGTTRIGARGQLIMGSENAAQWVAAPVNNGGTLRWLSSAAGSGTFDALLEMRPDALKLDKQLLFDGNAALTGAGGSTNSVELSGNLQVPNGESVTFGDDNGVEYILDTDAQGRLNVSFSLLNTNTPSVLQRFALDEVQFPEDIRVAGTSFLDRALFDADADRDQPQIRLVERGATDAARLAFFTSNGGGNQLLLEGVTGALHEDNLFTITSEEGTTFREVFKVDGAGRASVGRDAPLTSSTMLVYHGGEGMNIQNRGYSTAPSAGWELYQSSTSGNLNLYSNTGLVGNFNRTTGAYSATSDERLKTAIAALPAATAQLMSLRPKSYRYEAGAQEEHLGFLAQELQEVVPTAVKLVEGKPGEQGVYLVNYDELIPVVVKTIQEQQDTIDDLEARLARLERLLD